MYLEIPKANAFDSTNSYICISTTCASFLWTLSTGLTCSHTKHFFPTFWRLHTDAQREPSFSGILFHKHWAKFLFLHFLLILFCLDIWHAWQRALSCMASTSFFIIHHYFSPFGLREVGTQGLVSFKNIYSMPILLLGREI